MSNNNQSQPPFQYQLWDSRSGYISQPWAFWFQQFVDNLPPAGSGYVINGVQSTLGNVTVYVGTDANRGSAENGDIYFAYDSGKFYVANGTTWDTMVPSFSGDLSNAVGSTNLQLNTVNSSVGTFGNSDLIPRFTVNAKGLITSVTNVPFNASPGGVNESIQFNNNNIGFGGSPTFLYDSTADLVTLTDELVNGQITFTNPVPTRTNLLPTQTGLAGYSLVTDGTDVNWVASGPFEYTFNYGDATPRLLLTIPANKVIISCAIFITTGFNGVGATVSIGDASNYNSIMATTDSNVSMETNWSTNPGVVFGTATPIYISITAGSGATAGSGLLTLSFQE